MNGYHIALFIHLLFVLLASAAAAVALFASLRLRAAANSAEALLWLSAIRKVVPLFPVSVAGLLASGAYMSHQLGAWAAPWVDASLLGLGLIVALGSGVEGSRMRLLARELADSGLSPRSRRLLRDPVAWAAKMCTLTLVVAVVFIMTLKPATGGCAVALVAAIVAGVLGAAPICRSAPTDSPTNAPGAAI